MGRRGGESAPLSSRKTAVKWTQGRGHGGCKFMPPAGVGFYVCCAIQRTHVEEASRAMLPYLGVLVAGLLIVAFVPWFTLFLPHYFGFRG